MPQRTTSASVASGGYWGHFMNRPISVSAGPVSSSVNMRTGNIFFRNTLLYYGTAEALTINGGIWIALVRSDPDVRSVDVDINITFRQANFFSWGIGWADTNIQFDVGAVDIDSGRIFPVHGTTTFPLEREVWLGASGGPIFLFERTGNRAPDTINRRLRLPKPDLSSTRRLLIFFRLDAYTSGGPAIESRYVLDATLNSAQIVS